MDIELELKIACYRGARFCLHGDFSTAIRVFDASIRKYERLVAEGREDLLPDLAKTRMMLGNCLSDIGVLSKAKQIYEVALSDYQSLINQGRDELRPDLAKTRLNLGNCLSELGALSEAKQVYEMAQTEFQSLIDQGRDDLRPSLAKTRLDLGICLSDLGSLSKAKQIYEVALSEYQSLINQGRDDLLPELALTRMNLGVCLLIQPGALSKVQQIFEVALSEFQGLIDRGHDDLRPNLARTYLNLGLCLSKLGDLSKAKQIYEVAQSEYQRLINQGHDDLRPELAKTRMNLGHCLQELGALSKAQQILEEAQNEYQNLIDQGHDDLRPELAKTRRRLGICLAQLGTLSEAQQIFEEAQSEYQNLIDQGHEELRPDIAETRMNLGICLGAIGALSEAQQIFEEVQSEYQDLIDQGRDDLRSELARMHGSLGNCLSDLGAFLEARQVYEVAQNECQSLIAQGYDELRPMLAKTRTNLGNCLSDLGAFSEARQVHEVAQSEYQSLIDQGHDELRSELAITRGNLGTCLEEIGALSEAQQIYEMALSEFQNLINQGHEELRRDLALTRIGYAFCLLRVGIVARNNLRSGSDDNPSFFKKLGLFLRSLFSASPWSLLKKSLGEYECLIEQDGRTDLRRELAQAHMNYGICLIGDHHATEKHFQASLALLQELQAAGQHFPDGIKMMRVIADWHSHPDGSIKPDKPRAFELAQQGLDWLDILLGRISDDAKNFLLEQNIRLFHLAADLALELNHPDQAYLILERSKSRVLVEQMLREGADEPGTQVDEKLRTQYQQLRERLRQLVNQLAPPSGNTGEAFFFTPRFRSTERSQEQDKKLLEDQKEVEQKLAKVRAAIAEQDPAYGDAIQPRPLKTEQLITLIPANTLAIAFEQRPDYLHLYAITAQGVHTPLRVDLKGQELWERVDTFRKNLITEDFSDRHVKEVNHITEWLTEKLASVFNQLLEQHEPQEILFIPHQLWHLLPLHLIKIDEQALILRYPVRYMPSLQVLRLIHEREQANTEKGCLVANPDGSLPDAEEECRTIKNHYRPLDVLLEREQAHLDAVRQHLNGAQHGLMSCHGVFQPNLQACLKLADGSLQAKEMFTSLRLDNARFITLSACETAQILPTLADEYMGLVSSFLFAGAHNVLAALWSVESASTRLLMEDFYQGLADGLSPTIALQQAQRQLREMGRKTVQKRLQLKRVPLKIKPYKEPYYWAGFVLVGDGV
jgi:CHAT domain-containing protein